MIEINAHMSWIDFAIVGVYMLGMLAVGFFVYRKVPSFEEFFVAGRSMTTPILICTLVSTYYGVDVLFGTSELAYNDGVVAFFGYSQLSLAAYVFAAFALTKRLRKANFKSLPEILERNYGRGAGLLGALASLTYSIPALGLFGLGRVCEVILGFDARMGALLVGGVALAYTLMGGLWAVAITDTIQFVLMCLTLAFAVPLVMGKVGGFDAVAATAPPSFFEPFGSIPIWLVLAYGATGVSILVDPGFYQRVFAARDFRQARNALLIGLVVWGAYDWLVTAGGMFAVAAVNSGLLPVHVHPNDVLLNLVTLSLPVGLTGIFLAGVLATEMSTIDSYTLVAGGNLVYDIYRPLVEPDASDATLVRLTKFGICLSWVLGYGLAFAFERLLALWVFMSSLLVSVVMVPILMSLFWKGRKKPLAGLLSGLFGLSGVLLYYGALQMFGAANARYGTYILDFTVGGVAVSLWQEYAIFFTLPLSLLGFCVGNWLGRATQPRGAREEVEA
ncbi:MAG: sodium:solute symporter family protein [Myxococcales bacterium]|nr:sodium:solute symporter family protein [Myxococcales bacterium]